MEVRIAPLYPSGMQKQGTHFKAHLDQSKHFLLRRRRFRLPQSKQSSVLLGDLVWSAFL